MTSTISVLILMWFAPYNPAGSTVIQYAITQEQCAELGDAIVAQVKKAHAKHGPERGKLKITRQCAKIQAVSLVLDTP
jgi:hypothetical protein